MTCILSSIAVLALLVVVGWLLLGRNRWKRERDRLLADRDDLRDKCGRLSLQVEDAKTSDEETTS